MAERLRSLRRPPRSRGEDYIKTRDANAHKAIRVWWSLYDTLVYWAQCELIGRDILEQHPAQLTMWQDMNHGHDVRTEANFAQLLGDAFSRGGRVGDVRMAELLDRVGRERLDLLLALAATGLDAPGAFAEAFANGPGPNNTYLRDELRSGLVPGKEEEEDDTDGDTVAGKTKWKLEALRQVRFLVGSGVRKTAAQKQVGEAINHSIDDLQRWERDAVKFSDFENDLFCTELAGEFAQHFLSSHYSSIPNHRNYGIFEKTLNIERAQKLAHHMRRVRPSDIRAALRNVS